MSTKTGLKPFKITALISETHVRVGTIISFLFLFLFNVLSIESVIKLAEDPEFTNTECLQPSHFDHFFQTL